MSGYRPIIIFCCFIFTLLSLPLTRANVPDSIQINYEPCYIGCNYAFPHCYGYEIFNVDDAIKIKKWEIDGNLIKGRAVAGVSGNIIAKICYQVSITNKDHLLNDDLSLEAEFDFTVKLSGDSPEENINTRCISYEESTVSYLSFSFSGNALKKPHTFFPEIETALTYEMESVIEDSLHRAVYNSLTGSLPGGKDKRRIMYCGGLEAFSDSAEISCDCN